jgi:hypothetical protein
MTDLCPQCFLKKPCGCGPRIAPDEFLRVEWDNSTNFNVHDRNMIWCNYLYFCSRGKAEEAEREAKIMRSILAKIKLGQTVILRQELREGRKNIPLSGQELK